MPLVPQPFGDIARYSELVGAIYDSVLDPGQWVPTFERLCAELGMATSACSLHLLPSNRVVLDTVTGLSEADCLAQLDYAADLFELWGGHAALARPIDRPWVLSRLFLPEQIAANRFVREWGEPRGLNDTVALVIAREPGLVGSIGFGRHRDAGPIDDATIAKVELLMPHLQRAARITSLFDANSAALRSFESLVAAIVAPVILVRHDLSVVLCNRAAERFSDAGDVLTVTGGRIGSPVPGLRQALLKLLARIEDHAAAIGGPGLGLPVRTPCGHVHTLHILPLGGSDARGRLAEGAAAAIFVSSTALSQSPALSMVRPLFDLTAAEQRVFELIVSGRTISEAAAALDVAQSTIRTHLLRVFGKTGVNRQADLIRLAQALAPPLNAGPTLGGA